ncbi:MAG: DNA/RNA nuclease SfsA [Thermoplasmata archaeon]|nr:DNA/RNA nuclease SfsA [Thermoplasmata archaeon]
MVELLKIPWDCEGILKERPNRFLAIVDIEQDGIILKEQKVHVRDPGRLKELLFPGNKVLVRHRTGENRKTQWEIIAAWDNDWVLINSGYHRAISEAILGNSKISPFGKLDGLKAEVTVGHSRLDFMLEKDGSQIALEIKGCTLEIDNIALFPDAPTERGARHVQTLMDIVSEGKKAAMMILVLRPGAKCFKPNEITDPKFAEIFWKARKAGIEIHPVKLSYENGAILFHGLIPVCEVLPCNGIH